MSAIEPAERATSAFLKLEKISLSGFKSFCEPVDIEVSDGVTAIVGPNGCGKSNIGDAVNWVLGEQSPRQLRSSSMEDVIFHGTETRKPMGMAEVSLVFRSVGDSNEADGRVVVTRRLFRDGQSEYELNGARCRLKDIQELLREARIGSQTYATIEQGRIDEILNAKPKERRLLIEEAAGVAGFKHKRRLAELKLQATEANLLRVGDVLAEVGRQIGSVKRQAARARRYQRLRQELRERQQLRFALLARDLDGRLEASRKAEEEARREEAARAAEVAAAEAALVAGRGELEELARKAVELQRAAHRLELETGRKEERVGVLRQRISETEQAIRRLETEVASLATSLDLCRNELESRRAAEGSFRDRLRDVEASLASEAAELEESSRARARMAADIERLRRDLFELASKAAELKNRKRFVEEGLGRLASEQERLRRERADVDARREQAEAEWRRLVAEARSAVEAEEASRAAVREKDRLLGEARRRHEAAVEAAARAREAESSAVARLRALEDLEVRFAGVSDGVPLLLGEAASRGLRTAGVVADYLEASGELEKAAETYLQPLLPAVVVDEDADAEGAAAFVREKGAGRTVLLCCSQPVGARAIGSPTDGRNPIPREVSKDPRVVGRLREGLAFRAASNGAIGDRIGEAVVVDSLAAALELHRRYPDLDFVTLGGEVVYASGLVAVGGTLEKDRGLLAHGRKVRQAREEAEAAFRSAEALSAEVARARREIEEIEPELSARREAAESASRRRIEIEGLLERAAEEAGRLGRTLALLAEEARAVEEERAALEAERERCRSDLEEAERARVEGEERLEAALLTLESAERRLADRGERVAALREEVAAVRQQRSGAEREREEAERRVAEAASRLERARVELAALRARLEEDSAELGAIELALSADLAARDRSRSGSTELEQLLAQKKDAVERMEGLVREARGRLESAREATRSQELARAGAEADRRHLDELCLLELGCPASEAATSIASIPPEADPAALEQEIAELRERIERLGPVHLGALEEFSGLEERYQFLSAQKRDLEESVESLKESIRRINRSSRERFLEAFETIRRHYQETFRVLFGGGRADLLLEEGEDVLECGIEILAQPPGKRLGSVSLLSGGEKAMAGIALLFAVFRYQPSPFCLLDEVDAALDDVNVGRFTRMLRQYAGEIPFILITHNQRSMEVADVLYGVTMEEPGVSRLVSARL
jgi:chromosome segregation protein